MICECENEAALNIFEQAFKLTDEEKEAISRRRIAICTWQNEVSPSLIENWSASQRMRFANEWANDHGLCEESDTPSEVIESQTREGSVSRDACLIFDTTCSNFFLPYACTYVFIFIDP